MRVLVVGGGFSGATVAHCAKSSGHDVTVIDRRSHLAGNAHTEQLDGQLVHMFGPHVFHCSDERIWSFVNRFATFERYTHQARAIGQDGRLYSLPFSLQTFHEFFGVTTPEHAIERLALETAPYMPKGTSPATNAEDWCLQNLGERIYETLVRGHASKLWSIDLKRLPAAVIKRLPLRFDFNTDYFNDIYEGIPREGYTELITRMLDGCDTRLNTAWSPTMTGAYDITVYTGPLDELCGYELGRLDYHSLRFERYVASGSQGCTHLNDCRVEVPHTRTSESWLFKRRAKRPDRIWHVREFPDANGEQAYPLEDDANRTLHDRYLVLAQQKFPTFRFVGRMATYRYLDMHAAIGQAFKLCDELGWSPT